VDPSEKLFHLSTREIRVFCDWTIQNAGGYGRMLACDASGTPPGKSGALPAR
jgi:hypothetical protein